MSDDTAKKIEQIVNLMLDLSNEERMEVISQFCRYCGTDDPGCQCWNDE